MWVGNQPKPITVQDNCWTLSLTKPCYNKPYFFALLLFIPIIVMVFDIEIFYSSIVERLFTNDIQIAEEITETCDYDMILRNESRKTSFFFDKNVLCVLRDVTQFFLWMSMSCINEADVCS